MITMKKLAKAGSFGMSSGVVMVSPAAAINFVPDTEIASITGISAAIASGLATDDKALEKINEAYFAQKYQHSW